MLVILTGFSSIHQGFEDNIRKNRSVISNWLKYAEWEDSQMEIDRFVCIVGTTNTIAEKRTLLDRSGGRSSPDGLDLP